MCAAACAVAVALSAPAHEAGATTPEEEAALTLFKVGRNAFGAGDFDKALGLFLKTRDVVDNVYVRYYIARTYTALGRCPEALPILTELENKLPGDAEGPRRDDLRRCLLREARAHVKAERCKEALPLLRSLEGLTTGVSEEWRMDTVPWCEARITDFLTDTPMRNAAYKLYEAGKAAEQAGDPDKAAALYRKGLKLTNDAHLRETLAWVLSESADCDALREALGERPADAGEHHLLVACTRYGTEGRLVGAQLRAYLTEVVSGLDAIRAGESEAAAGPLGSAAGQGGNPALMARYIDLLYDLRRCDDYLGAVAAATEVTQALVTEREDRTDLCESGDAPPPLAPGSGAPDGGQASGDPVSVTASSGEASRFMELSLLGLGGAAIIGAAVVTVLWAGTTGELSDAEATWNDLTRDPDVRIAAFDSIPGLQDDAATQGTMALTLGLVGIGAAATGAALLLFGDQGPTEPGDETAVTGVTPFLTDQVVGLQGRF